MRKTLVFLLLSLLGPPAFPGETAAPPDPRGNVRGSFFSLSVADITAQSAWYRETLGLDVAATIESPDKSAKLVLLEGPGLLVELMQHREAKERQAAAPAAKESFQIHGFFKAGFIVDDIDRLYAGLKAKKIPMEVELVKPEGGPMRTFILRDPEGNLLQFFGK